MFLVKRLLIVLFVVTLIQPATASETRMPQVGIEEIKTGSGDEATPFSIVEVHYTGKLEDGTVFDSSVSRGQPIQFTLGVGQVIPGWDMGLIGMRTNGSRVLKIPAELAYGARGAGGVIPPHADLVFEVELLSVKAAVFSNIDNAGLQSRLKKGVKLIDIRRPEEWQQTGVVEGSIKLTAFDQQGRFLKSFVDGLREIATPDEEVLLICRTGSRTASLSQWLATQGGYDNVVNVTEGITAWIAEDRPVVTTN